ncbi:MAG: hypothetical protein ACYDA6_10575 [Solirubrobacteraceae bacterium]
MSRRWVIEVTDITAPPLVSGAGTYYRSPPHSDEEAQRLLALLLGQMRKAGSAGPWRHAIPGGRREVALHRHQPTHTRKEES